MSQAFSASLRIPLDCSALPPPIPGSLDQTISTKIATFIQWLTKPRRQSTGSSPPVNEIRTILF